MKRIGLVSGDVTCGLTYQRGHIMFRHLKDRYEIVPISMHELDHAKALYLDAIVLFHPYHNEHLMIAQRAMGHYQIPVIVDIDDLVTNLPVDHPEYAAFQGNRVCDIIQVASHVVVSTEYLKKTWAHLNKNMTVIENCIDERRYQGLIDAPKPYKTGFVVGWTGGQTHRPDLYNTGFVDGLMRFMDAHDDVRAYFHCLCPQILLDRYGSRVIYQQQPVDYLDYPSLCFTFPWDICCVPLHDHPFNHAKSDLRLLDMSPFKIPLLASPVADFVKHRDRGVMFYAENGKWFEALEDVYSRRNELQSVAKKSHSYVMTERTAKQQAERWADVLETVLPQGLPGESAYLARHRCTCKQGSCQGSETAES